MEVGKQGSSETSSSEENETRDHHHRHHHQQQAVVEEDTITTSNPWAATKRFYECSYCKKGFDNAQALGGHMNIHRGAKAKAKQATGTTSNPSIAMIKSNEEYSNPSYGNMAPRGGFYPSLEARSNYHVHMYSQPSGSIPGQAEFVVLRPASSTSNDELLGSNLSLRIGSGDGEEDGIGTGKVGEEDEVDLELRLGHHDRY